MPNDLMSLSYGWCAVRGGLLGRRNPCGQKYSALFGQLSFGILNTCPSHVHLRSSMMDVTSLWCIIGDVVLPPYTQDPSKTLILKGEYLSLLSLSQMPRLTAVQKDYACNCFYNWMLIVVFSFNTTIVHQLVEFKI